LWNGIKPVFADIDPVTLSLDPDKIEAAITPQTTAIMPVHCYGYPCDVDRIQRIADMYGLKVIYDAAHAFGVRYQGQSLLNHGDLSVLSFHATKVFNTFEGGAIISQDAKTKQRVDFLKNFGIANETTVVAPGINGKMSEINAAFGLLQLKSVGEVQQKRAALDAHYRERLAGVRGISVMSPVPGMEPNHSYFPIFVGPKYGRSRDALFDELRARAIHARRYFYPLISEFPMYRGQPSAAPGNLPIASQAAREVICLPFYPALPLEQADAIIDIVVQGARA
jgi:dTDP-4-amino-4,6-dideoxygalactose transaminase